MCDCALVLRRLMIPKKPGAGAGAGRVPGFDSCSFPVPIHLGDAD